MLRTPQGNRGNRACAMKPSVAILKKKYPDLSRLGVHTVPDSYGIQNIHSGERVEKGPDSPANSPDTCWWKGVSGNNKLRIKNIRIRVEEDFVTSNGIKRRKEHEKRGDGI